MKIPENFLYPEIIQFMKYMHVYYYSYKVYKTDKYFLTRCTLSGGPYAPGSLKTLSCRYVCTYVYVYTLGIIALFMGVKSNRV